MTLKDYAHQLREKGFDSESFGNPPKSIIVTEGGKRIVLGLGQELEDLLAGRTQVAQLWASHRLNSCAIMTFRDTADGDYINARLAFRAGCFEQFLWNAEQSIEKYLKCILVLRRVRRPPPDKHGRRADMGHELLRGIDMIGRANLKLSSPTLRFVEFLDKTAIGARYFEVPTVANGDEHVPLDRAVWELRRFCTPSVDYSDVMLQHGVPAPKIRLDGRLERIMDDPQDPAREALLWQNGFFGGRTRRKVGRPKWGFSVKNAPLWIMPDVAAEFTEYAYLPERVATAYQTLAKQRMPKNSNPQGRHPGPTK